MVVLNKIYTKTGDAGETALVNGARVSKACPRVQAYGTVDELNSVLGMARLHATDETAAALARIQNDLFDLGADLARPEMARDAEAGYPVLRVIAARRNAKRPLGNTHANPAPAAEIAPLTPKSAPERAAATSVAINCSMTALSIRCYRMRVRDARDRLKSRGW